MPHNDISYNNNFDVNNSAINSSDANNSYSDALDAQSNDQSERPNLDGKYDDTLLNCAHCGGYIRPDIVWFGEALPVQAWHTAESAAANCEVFMSISTSSLVYPAAGLAQVAKKNGAKIIEINPNPMPSTIVDITLAANAGVVMPQLVKQISALLS